MTPTRSHRARHCSVALAALLACGLAQAAAPRTTLTLFSAAENQTVRALNDQGQVAGTLMNSLGVTKGFVWSAAAGISVLDGFSETDSAFALDINNQGQVVGWSIARGAYIWTPGSGVLSLRGPTGELGGEARSINDLGEVAGRAQLASGRSVATTWDASGNPRQLAGDGSARAINNLGQVMGVADYRVDDSGVTRASWYRWPATGTPIPLPVDLDVRINHLNNRGEMVGLSVQRSTGQVGAVLWRSDLSATPLLNLSEGIALNDAQQVIGRQHDSALGHDRIGLWRNGHTTLLDTLVPGGFMPVQAADINALAQIAGEGITAGGELRPFLLTLHPDWTGGDGAWNDNTGTRWNWAGTGTAAARVGAVHDVVIDPGRSATITGAAEGRARTLQIGGTTGTVVTLNLSGGTTTLGDGDGGLANPSAVRQGGVVTGSGRLIVGETLAVQAGGRVEVGPGQRMELQADELRNGGRIQVLGTAVAPAELQTSGWRYHFTNDAAGQVLVQHGTLRLGGGLQNFGRVSLQSARLLADDTVLNHADAQLSFSFGESVVDAVIDNRGLLVVSNGARASFHGLIDNPGELRISSGGAANFFGEVLISGSFTGGGDAMFEGGVTLPFGQTVQMGPHTTLAGATLRLVGSADGLGLGDRVDVFDWFTGVEGRFTALTLPSLADGLVWDTSDLYAGGTLAVAAVPEPGTWALWLAGAAALAGLQRRRRAES